MTRARHRSEQHGAGAVEIGGTRGLDGNEQPDEIVVVHEPLTLGTTALLVSTGYGILDAS